MLRIRRPPRPFFVSSSLKFLPFSFSLSPPTPVAAAADFYLKKKAEDWCDGSSHIRWMPTKQNVLCQEQSVWQVMEAHRDFYNYKQTDGSSSIIIDSSDSTTMEPLLLMNDIHSSAEQQQQPFFPPEFEYVLPPSNGNRYVLVLDRSVS